MNKKIKEFTKQKSFYFSLVIFFLFILGIILFKTINKYNAHNSIFSSAIIYLSFCLIWTTFRYWKNDSKKEKDSKWHLFISLLLSIFFLMISLVIKYS